ncbi:MAG: glutamate racemase [Oscillospiraceae bacterium]|jgi:glutamate racemase
MAEKARIGVIDSGVGGLTFVREILALCPGADIIYFGDSANCPYGNQTRERILELTFRALSFLQQSHIHVGVIACNTISTLIDTLQSNTATPLFSVVSPAAEAVARSGARRVGILGTEFTIAVGTYQKLIQEINPNIEVASQGSLHLAALVDQGAPVQDIEEEIQSRFGPLLEHNPPPETVILGCTHYPIVKDIFVRRYPDIEFLDPAVESAKALTLWLKQQELETKGQGTLKIYTSGTLDVYQRILEQLQIPAPCVLEHVIP